MQVSEVIVALKDLFLASFREPALLWQLAPIIVLWVILIVYFATHKKEQLGWNTSLTNGITLFWVVMGTMQHIFSNNREFFTWTKFGLFLGVIAYAIFIIYISFRHALSEKTTYLVASQNPILYFSVLVLLYAHDMIYFTWPMLIAIVILFFFILLGEFLLIKLLPEMDEGDAIEKEGDSFGAGGSEDMFSAKDESVKSNEPGGIETSMGENNFDEADFKF